MDKTDLKQKIELLLDKIRKFSGHSPIYNQNEIAALINNTKDLYDSLLVFHFLQQNAEPHSSNEKKSVTSQVIKGLPGINTAASSNTLQTVGKSMTPEVSINEKVSFSQNKNKAAKRINHKSIADLKAAIGINEKFLFINELFGGDSDCYVSSIDRLNSFSNHTEAMEYIDTILREKHNWDEESNTLASLMELVEKRYAS